MNRFPCMVINVGHIVHLGMTIMAWGDTVRSFGCKDLVGLGLAISPSLLLETGLKISATAATTKIIGSVGSHVNKIFFTHDCFNNISQVFGNRITKGFSDQLARVLNSKFNFSVLVPVGRWF